MSCLWNQAVLITQNLVCVRQVVYIKKDNEELVIVDPDWLGADVIGRLLCHESLAQLPVDGRLSTDHIRAAIPSSPPLDMTRLLATMYLCAPLHPELDNDVVVPCLDRTEEPSLELRRPLVNGFDHTPDKVHRRPTCRQYHCTLLNILTLKMEVHAFRSIIA